MRERAAAVRDWPAFEAVVARHRVGALAESGLRRAGVSPPPSTAQGLARDAARAARDALVMARESLRLQREFDAADIRAVFVKGTALALLAYRDLGVKQSWDIDLLVAPDRAMAGRRLLERLGYALHHPDLNDRQFERFIPFAGQCAFFNAALGTTVELHWRLLDNERLLTGVDACSPTQDVELGGGAIRTLADAPLFAFLCAHGALHGWSRLKWLADLSAFLARRSQSEIERLYGEAARIGGGRTASAALLLCHDLLDVALAPEFLRRLRSDGKAVALTNLAMRCIGHAGGSADFGPYSPTGIRLTLSHFTLRPGHFYLAGALRIWWNSAFDRARIALPPPLSFLHHVIRVPLALSRFGLKSARRLRT